MEQKIQVSISTSLPHNISSKNEDIVERNSAKPTDSEKDFSTVTKPTRWSFHKVLEQKNSLRKQQKQLGIELDQSNNQESFCGIRFDRDSTVDTGSSLEESTGHGLLHAQMRNPGHKPLGKTKSDVPKRESTTDSEESGFVRSFSSEDIPEPLDLSLRHFKLSSSELKKKQSTTISEDFPNLSKLIKFVCEPSQKETAQMRASSTNSMGFPDVKSQQDSERVKTLRHSFKNKLSIFGAQESFDDTCIDYYPTRGFLVSPKEAKISRRSTFSFALKKPTKPGRESPRAKTSSTANDKEAIGQRNSLTKRLGIVSNRCSIKACLSKQNESLSLDDQQKSNCPLEKKKEIVYFGKSAEPKSVAVIGSRNCGKTMLVKKLKECAKDDLFGEFQAFKSAKFIEIDAKLRDIWLAIQANVYIVLFSLENQQSFDEAANCIDVLNKRTHETTTLFLVANRKTPGYLGMTEAENAAEQFAHSNGIPLFQLSHCGLSGALEIWWEICHSKITHNDEAGKFKPRHEFRKKSKTVTNYSARQLNIDSFGRQESISCEDMMIMFN